METSTKAPADDEAALAARLRPLESPAVYRSLERRRRAYGKDVASIEEVREMLDAALGDRKLSDLVDEIRGRH